MVKILNFKVIKLSKQKLHLQDPILMNSKSETDLVVMILKPTVEFKTNRHFF